MADRDERPEMLAALLRQEQEMQLHGMELWKRLWEDRGMASIQKLEERNARAVDAHERTAQRLAALKAKFDREEKVLQARRDKVNMLWVKKFAELAEKENIQVSKIDAEQLLALVKENKASKTPLEVRHKLFHLYVEANNIIVNGGGA